MVNLFFLFVEILPDYRIRPLVYVEPDATMLDAVRKLCLHKIHRLPVIDPQTGNVIYILTHRRLLRYVYCVVSRSVDDVILSK